MKLSSSVALQKKAVPLILKKLPSLPRKAPGRAEKPLVLVPGLGGEAGFQPKPEPTVVFVVVDFIKVPAVVL